MRQISVRLAALGLGVMATTVGVHAQPQTTQYLETPLGQKPRVVITADPELDDANSMIRYLLYSSDVRTEGLIYASSQFHWMGDGKGTKFSVPNREYNRWGLNLCPCASWRWEPGERFIDTAVETYAKAYPNLRVHNTAYPSPELLKSKIRWGNVQFDGEMEKDTAGSDLIKSLLLDNEEAPIYLHAWGGMSTIARALKSIEDQYKQTVQWAAIRAKVIRKAVIHPSGDQDDTYANYIKPNWPEIRYRQQDGGVPLGYNTQASLSEADAAYFTADWMKAHITSRGPLGALERVWGDGKQMVQGDRFDYFGLQKSAETLKKEGYIVWLPPRTSGEFLGEGDSFTFLNLVDNGLRGYRGDSFGGWGGHARTSQEPDSFAAFMAASDTAMPPSAPPPITRAPTNPFIAPAQNDWAARFQWAVTSNLRGANHNPKIKLHGPTTIRAKAGSRIKLSATPSDPDGDMVTLKWWVWKEAGTYQGTVALHDWGRKSSLTIPIDAKTGDTMQIIAEATDNGYPSLTTYSKIVITVSR